MKKFIKLFVLIITVGVLLTACGTTPTTNNNSSSNNSEAETVEYTFGDETVQIPVNPEVVVSLDNRTFETLADWDVKLAAVPKAVMVADSPYVLDETVLDVGNHREPNLEVIAAVEPDLVIVGQRFANYYQDIKELVPNAVVINVNIDVSETAESTGDNLVNGFKDITTLMGQIFDKNDEATSLIGELETSIENAKAAYNGTDTVMSVIVSGGTIGYSAPGVGRVWGPLYGILGLVSPLDVDNTTTDHQGDEISNEAIAESNPDWMFVLDRDAGTSTADSKPAKDVIDESPIFSEVTAIKENQILYAPNDTYTNESIQTFIEIFNSIAEVFSK